MAETKGGFTTLVGDPSLANTVIPAAALGVANGVKTAVVDNASYRVLHNGAHIWAAVGGVAKRIVAKLTGVAGDVKAVSYTIVGTDTNGDALTEVLLVFTVNTLGSVTSVAAFKTIDSITMPAHDGTGVISQIGVYGDDAVDGVLAAFTDKGAQTIHAQATINNPAVPRNITATAGGTAADIADIQPIVNGTNVNDEAITETLPVFTENTAGIVLGSKAFKTVTSLEIPPHDATGATTAFGTGAKLGIGQKLTRDSIINTYLNGVREGTRPTVAFDGSHVESNTVLLNSALTGTDVEFDFVAD